MAYAIVMTALVSYLLGNLNGAVTMSFLFSHDDVRTHGSGNAGLTNFIRNYGVANAALVLLIDVGKTVLSCLLGGLLLEPYGFALEGKMLGAVAVSLGHDFPALLGFKGGKGIVCGAAVAMCIDWRVGLVSAAVFFALYFLTRYVSLGSLGAAVSFGLGFTLCYRDRSWIVLGSLFMVVMAVFMHRENILRLCKGTERRSDLFGKGKKS